MKIFGSLYFRVLLATVLGALFGYIVPAYAEPMKILGESFINLVKMVIGPVVFCTIVLGIAGTGSMKKVGRVGGKALLYFEVVSTFALAIGLLVGNILQPGSNFHVNPAALDSSAVANFTERAKAASLSHIVTHLIPSTVVDAFTGSGDLLQVLLVALLFGYALSHVGEKAKPVHLVVEGLSHIFFKIVNVIMQLAPLGAFGAMAFTVGAYGWKSLGPLLALMGSFYLTCVLFVVLVLGLVARWVGFSIFSFLWYIREELLLVLSTSSSESALVPMMARLEELGCEPSTVGLVIPTGYSFNLDGTNIYLTLSILFLAQAVGISLSFSQQAALLLVAVLSSKGASGVTGAGFVTLAATLTAVPTVPVAALALILGIDRFMSEARALTNVIGNGVATLAISRWEGELDQERLRLHLRQGRSRA